MQTPCPMPDAMARKYPEAVAIAIVRDPAGKYNPITLGWVMCTSHQPAMFAISIGQGRHSLAALRHSGEFVLAFPAADQAEFARYCGSHSGRDTDKLRATAAATRPALLIDGVLLAAAVANFECRVISELETGDHVIFAAQVVRAHQHADAERPRLYSLGGGRLGPAAG